MDKKAILRLGGAGKDHGGLPYSYESHDEDVPNTDWSGKPDK